jgi:hypothetical protein
VLALFRQLFRNDNHSSLSLVITVNRDNPIKGGEQ